jgi:hypothetical protein
MLLGLRCQEEKGKKEMPLGRESELKLNNKKVNSRRLTFKEEDLHIAHVVLTAPRNLLYNLYKF